MKHTNTQVYHLLKQDENEEENIFPGVAHRFRPKLQRFMFPFLLLSLSINFLSGIRYALHNHPDFVPLVPTGATPYGKFNIFQTHHLPHLQATST
jgi:hypothetical protein